MQPGVVAGVAERAQGGPLLVGGTGEQLQGGVGVGGDNGSVKALDLVAVIPHFNQACVVTDGSHRGARGD